MPTRAAILKESATYPTPEELERGYLEQANTVETITMANDFRAAIGTRTTDTALPADRHPETGHVDGFEALMRWNHPGIRPYFTGRFHSHGRRQRPDRRGHAGRFARPAVF